MIPIRRLIPMLFIVSAFPRFGVSAFAGPPLGVAPAALSQAESLQAVIDRGGPLVYVPKGTYTTDRTIKLRSNLVLYCEEGTVIEAAAGAFTAVKEPDSCLVAGERVDNVAIYNCTFRMRKADYGVYKVRADGTYDLSPNALGYVPGEWRHTLYFAGVANVLLSNVKANSSGGDGLLVGAYLLPDKSKAPSRDVRVQRSTFTDNYRQGVSILSCMGDCAVEDCVFVGTKGASPQAGLDVEPEWGDTAEITVRRCQSIGNRGPAFMVGLFKAQPTTAPSKISFQDCTWSAVPPDQPTVRWGGLQKVVEFKDAGSWINTGYPADYLPVGTWVTWNGTDIIRK